MTRRTVIAAVLLMGAALWTSCRKEDDLSKDDAPSVEVPEGCLWLSLQASKGADTKALALAGSTLNASWIQDEPVKVFLNGTCIGTLTATPNGTDPTKATLSGTLTQTSGVVADAVLTLLFPRETWNYTAQAGTLDAIAANFDYAVATATVKSVVGTTVQTEGSVTFRNQQSVYRFGFTRGGNAYDPKDFTISAAGGKLVQSFGYSSGWAPAYGDITVTPASAPGDHLYYVSLRNESTAADTYNFQITGSDDALYFATKSIAADKLGEQGKFLSATGIAVSQPAFAPAPSGVIEAPENVL